MPSAKASNLHIERWAAHWAEVLAGPTTSSDTYGDEMTVVRTRSGNGAHEEMDHPATAGFDQVLTDVGLAGKAGGPAGASRLLRLAWATTTAMSRSQESADDVPLV